MFFQILFLVFHKNYPFCFYGPPKFSDNLFLDPKIFLLKGLDHQKFFLLILSYFESVFKCVSKLTGKSDSNCLLAHLGAQDMTISFCQSILHSHHIKTASLCPLSIQTSRTTDLFLYKSGSLPENEKL